MLWKKAMILGMIGFAAGALIGVILYLTDPSGGFAAAVPHILMGGLEGAAAMGSSVMYDIEKWSLIRATVTHFLLVFVLYFLIVVTMKWFRLDDPVFWIVIAGMAAGYAVVWLIQYLAYRRTIRKMNEDLARLKAEGNRE